MERDEFMTQTVDWLNRRVAPEGVTVDADTMLFECGIVDSLGILRLIAWTERAIGRRIQDREIRMDRFGSVRIIADNFAAPLVGVGVGSVVGVGCRTRAGDDCARCGACVGRAA